LVALLGLLALVLESVVLLNGRFDRVPVVPILFLFVLLEPGHVLQFLQLLRLSVQLHPLPFNGLILLADQSLLSLDQLPLLFQRQGLFPNAFVAHAYLLLNHALQLFF
jgi:hypothetical protein